ncbi:MAG: HAMP domain-containing histidine kinase [Candidatus Lokiarchaeota archaeon]|nr:HAMP domain-containing histidine kinase [Candidatus Lokiarchaeota archaeon]
MQDVENVYQDAYYRTTCFKGLFIHDISNLFQIISNSIELCESLLKDEVKTGDIMDFFQMIVQQLNRGKKLIRSFRNLSELGENEMPLAPMEVFSTLKSSINSTHINFPKKDIDIKVISDYGNLYIMANELLSEVFQNIITNSIIYNKNKVVQIEVIISVFDIHYKNYVKIEFKDNGIGIDDARKEIIFQETHLKNRHSKGMGIGLSLVAKLIELYGGNIWVENRIKGDSSKGSNFIIIIPLVKKKREMSDDRCL